MEDRETLNAVVFVVEDDPVDREAMREALAGLGCAVIAFNSIEAAVNLLRNDAACDLVIVSTDAMDESATHFDELVAVRTPAPQIIVYGVDPYAKLVLHSLNKGARDFLAKPFNRSELVHAVEAAVHRDEDPAATSGQPDAIVGSSPVGGWIEITASSELEQFRRLQRFSDALFASRLPPQVVQDLKMAMEEVVRNAVEWGNHFDPDKQVHISYCTFDDRVVIKVEDEGEGFKPEKLPDPTADPVKTMKDRQDAGKRPGGYGVFLIQRLVDDIVYNEKGNTVLLIKYLPE